MNEHFGLSCKIVKTKLENRLSRDRFPTSLSLSPFQSYRHEQTVPISASLSSYPQFTYLPSHQSPLSEHQGLNKLEPNDNRRGTCIADFELTITGSSGLFAMAFSFIFSLLVPLHPLLFTRSLLHRKPFFCALLSSH